MAAKPIPEGDHTLTPYFTVRDAVRAIEFYKQAFGAEERGIMKGPDGKVMRAELKIGDSIVMLADEFPEFGAIAPESGGSTRMGLHTLAFGPVGRFDRSSQKADVRESASGPRPSSTKQIVMFSAPSAAFLSDLSGQLFG